MPATWPDCACAGVETGTTQDRVTAGATDASTMLARLPMPVSTEPLTLPTMPAARATAATSMARNRPRLGRIDRHDLRRALLDDLDHVMGIPRAFVCHHRRIDRACHLGQPRDALHRLLEIDEVAARHALEGPDRFRRRRIALVGVDAQRDFRPDGIAHPRH